MLTIRLSSLVSYISALYVLLASIVLLSPSHEVAIWFGISAVVFLPSILIAIFSGNVIERLISILSVIFLILIPFGFPGTLLGWSGSMLIGLQSGRVWFRNMVGGSLGIVFLTFSVGPIFSANIIYLFASVGISHELQSNFFQAASINYASALLLGCASLVGTCLIVRGIYFRKKDVISAGSQIFIKVMLFLILISILFVLIMDYRSGFIGVLGVILFIISRMPKVASRLSLLFLLIFTIIFYSYIVDFLVPGRDGLDAIFTELVDEDNRVTRAVNFSAQVFFNKVDFNNWTKIFSVSALSDFMSVSFPLSIGLFIYLLIYIKNILRIGLEEMRVDQRLSFFLLVSSGIAIPLLQPDFFNMFVLGFQASLIAALSSLRRARFRRELVGVTRLVG